MEASLSSAPHPPEDFALRTKSLVRRFGDFTAVDGIDLELRRGVFFGFLGPNGAGKSTTIKMLTGVLAPTAGSAEILGFDLEHETVEAKRRVGVLPEELALFDRREKLLEVLAGRPD